MDENPSDLVGKEFVFEYGIDRILPPSERTGCAFATEQRAYRRERVVRCRDCVHAVRSSTKSIIGTEVVTLTCSGPIQGAYSEGGEVAPDGFCAWGEPRGEGGRE